MKTLIFATLIIGLMFVGQSFQISNEVVHLALYYEPLCPASRDFISDGLFPTYPKISSFTNVTLNPYGNAQRTEVDGRWNFTCQHGPKECKLAKLSACSLQKLDQADQINLINCLFPFQNAEKCITDVHLNYTEILKCANGEMGEDLLAKYGEETDALQPKHTFVPYIVFNGVFSRVLQDEAINDLLTTVCSLLETENKPSECLKENDLLYLSSNNIETSNNFNLVVEENDK